MSRDDRFVATMLAVGGPRWQRLEVGDRVQRIGARPRSKVGTVIAIVPPWEPGGISTHVQVRWPKGLRAGERWATDCLTIVSEDA